MDVNDTQAFREHVRDTIDHIHDCVEKLKDKHDDTVSQLTGRVIVLETHVNALVKAAWGLFGTVLLAILAALLKLVIK